MFDRIKYKTDGKMCLNGKVFDFFVITILTGVISGIGSVNSFDSAIGIITVVSSLAIGIFISVPLKLGIIKYSLNATKDEQKLEDVFYAFKCGNYTNVLGVYLLMLVKIFLWSLLFIIPGVIKSMEYYCVPYIIVEDPDINYKDAFRKSKEYTDNNKMNIFVMDLSFIGWALLVPLTCGILSFWLNGYMNLSFAFMYNDMKGEIVSNDYEEVINVEIKDDDTL